MSLRIHRQIGPARKILPNQTIGVLVGPALPRISRIAEVTLDGGPHHPWARPVRASDADEIIDDRIDIPRLDRCSAGHRIFALQAYLDSGSGIRQPNADHLPSTVRDHADDSSRKERHENDNRK